MFFGDSDKENPLITKQKDFIAGWAIRNGRLTNLDDKVILCFHGIEHTASDSVSLMVIIAFLETPLIEEVK